MAWNPPRDHWLKALDDEPAEKPTGYAPGYLDAFDNRLGDSLKTAHSGNQTSDEPPRTGVGALGRAAPIVEPRRFL